LTLSRRDRFDGRVVAQLAWCPRDERKSPPLDINRPILIDSVAPVSGFYKAEAVSKLGLALKSRIVFYGVTSF